jgi:lipopolysaccharide/colanic/teichoic acid biosynthesis glycosyltransferase
MHLLLIHQAFTPPTEAGGTRHYEFARHLVKKGHRVTIVASDLSYLTGRRAAEGRSLVTAQDLNGVRVLRAYTYPSLHRSFFWRVISFLSFMLTSIVAALRAGPVDLVMGTSPPLFQAVSAWVVSILRRKDFLLEIRDLWPEFAIDLKVLRSPFLIFLSRWLERFLYSRADHLLVNSPAYRGYLIQKGVSPGKISLIPNGVNPDAFDPNSMGQRFREKWNLHGKFVVTYAGSLGMANDLPTLLRAADLLREDAHTCFVLAGDGKERARLEAMTRQLELPNVIFTGAIPKEEMPAVLAASDACVAILKNISMFRTTYPNKVFDYMAAGRPTILAIDGVIREVVESARGGIFVPPGDSRFLAGAVRRLKEGPMLAKRMGASARAYVEENFNRRRQAEDFEELLQKARPRRPFSLYRLCGKRCLDLGLSMPGLLFFLPLLAGLALLVRVRLGSPVFFRQKRPGFKEKPFNIFKFRTMKDIRNQQGLLLPDGERMTPLGKFMRRSSLDELPELLNVVKGEMSLVGPRPLLMSYLDRYSEAQRRRHEVKPGITGWTQVNGRNALTWEEKFRLDSWYVDHCSLALDLKILFRTIGKVFAREGISQPGEATMGEFLGTALKH